MKANHKVHPVSFNTINVSDTSGITARDYIAIEAMKALISNPDIKRPQQGTNLERDHANFSRVAYKYADSLIEQSEK